MIDLLKDLGCIALLAAAASVFGGLFFWQIMGGM